MKYALMLATLLALPAHAGLNGNQLLSKMEGSKKETNSGTVDYAFVGAYVSGVIDGLSASGAICTPETFSYSQGISMTENFLLQSPELRHGQAVLFVTIPLMKNFPCPPKDKPQ